MDATMNVSAGALRECEGEADGSKDQAGSDVSSVGAQPFSILTGLGKAQVAIGDKDGEGSTAQIAVASKGRRAATAPARRSPSSSPPARGGSVCGGVKPKADGKCKPGRPKMDWPPLVQKEVESFAASTETSQLYWGSEADTKLRDLHKQMSDIKTRINNSQDVNEVDELKRLLKKMDFIAESIRTVQQFGLGSEEFKRVYDLLHSTLALSDVTLPIPKFLQWAREKMDIGISETPARWMEKVSSTQLKANGVSDVLDEQVRLWCEKLASILRTTDKAVLTTQFPQYFSVDCSYDLEEPVSFFAQSIAVCLGLNDFDLLTDRIDLLTDAISQLDAHHLPCLASGTPVHAGCLAS